jgi:hypothetical protein
MRRQLVPFATPFVQPKPPPFALLVVVLHAHADHCTHAGKTVDHHPDQGAIAQPANGVKVNMVDHCPCFLGAQHRRAAGLDHVLGSPHGVGRVGRQHLLGDQGVEQHAQGGQVLLDGVLGVVLP